MTRWFAHVLAEGASRKGSCGSALTPHLDAGVRLPYLGLRYVGSTVLLRAVSVSMTISPRVILGILYFDQEVAKAWGVEVGADIVNFSL